MDAPSIIVRGRATMAASPVKGLFLKPGSFTLHVNGMPLEVEFTKPVIMAAYAELKERLGRGERLPMKLAHAGLGDLPIEFGSMKDVRVDPDKGEVWLTASDMLPEMDRVLTAEAREKLLEMALSMDSRMRVSRGAGNKFTATELHVDGLDIVKRGAFDGSDIVQQVPLKLVAQAMASRSSGGSGPRSHGQEGTTMPQLGSVNDIPEEVRKELTPEQQAAYLAAYNAAIEQGKNPLEAHEVAWTAACAKGQGATEDDKKKETEAKGKAEIAFLRAEAQRAVALEAELKTIRATAQAAAPRLDALERDLKDVKAQAAKLEQEKQDRLASDDVGNVIAQGKAGPAQRETLVSARKAMGSEAFLRMAAAMPVVIPIGERGVQSPPGNSDTPTGPKVDTPEGLVKKWGVDAVFASGLVDVRPDLRVHLAASHPNDPQVRNRLQPELKALAAKANGNGGGR